MHTIRRVVNIFSTISAHFVNLFAFSRSVGSVFGSRTGHQRLTDIAVVPYSIPHFGHPCVSKSWFPHHDPRAIFPRGNHYRNRHFAPYHISSNRFRLRCDCLRMLLPHFPPLLDTPINQNRVACPQFDMSREFLFGAVLSRPFQQSILIASWFPHRYRREAQMER